jgi:hypothetical protein
MRSTLLLCIFPGLFLLLLLPLCFAGADKSASTISDLPPGAQAVVATAMPEPQIEYSLTQGVWAQLAELTVSNSIYSGPQLGTSVAITGNIVVMGTPYGGTAGAVYVYVKPRTGWSNLSQSAVLVPSDGQDSCDNFGSSISVSGNTVVVGASQSNPNCISNGPGSAYVFVEPPGGWSGQITETAKLTASDGAVGDALGSSVAISGNTVVAGQPGGTTSAGYVFVMPATGWTSMTQTAKLTSTSDVDLGVAVAISGNTAAVTASGAVDVYVEPSGGWVNTTQTARLTASQGGLGPTVGISGNTVVAGAPTINSYEGAAYVYVEPAGGWRDMTETAMLTPPGGRAGDSFGSSVAISGDRAALGAPYYARGYILYSDYPAFWREGAVYVFSKTAKGWDPASVSVARMNGADARYDALLGTSVGISGNLVVTGAPYLGHYSGSTYIFGVQ